MKNTRILRHIVAFGIAMSATYITLSPSMGEAMDRRDMASSCALSESYYVPNLVGQAAGESNPAGTSWARTDYDTHLSCPYRDDDRFKRHEVNTLNVHVYDGSTSRDVNARACILYYGTGGGSCGTVSTSSGVGDKTLTPGLGAWSSANQSHFGYIAVFLPRFQSGGSPSALRGWWTST